MTCSAFQYSNHAVAQMFKRGISADEVEEVVAKGEVIRSYPNDTPYPSWLMLHFVNSKAIHVVVSQHSTNGICYVVTAYLPDPLLWSSDFKVKI